MNKSNARRVSIYPKPLKRNGRATINYNGFLASFPGNKIYIHYGYGANMGWNNVGQQEMVLTDNGYKVSIPVRDGEYLNFCFHDNQGRWDNNHGNNWSCEIQQ